MADAWTIYLNVGVFFFGVFYVYTAWLPQRFTEFMRFPSIQKPHGFEWLTVWSTMKIKCKYKTETMNVDD